jgi:DNA-binding response OmpR family regulator
MTHQHGRILLADDEPLFSAATADLLRREGYEVDTVGDAPAAIAAVEATHYDLVISDLEMPGNDDMALLRRVTSSHGGLPVIVLTGYPSIRSAMTCIDLPCAAYLTKPVEFPALLDKTRTAIQRYRAWQAMRRSEERLQAWRTEMEELATSSPTGGGVDTFLSLTLRNVMGSLTDLKQVGEALTTGETKVHTCQLINCPRGGQLYRAVEETVEVLESTKGSFKSKALGDLRRKLELLLQHA